MTLISTETTVGEIVRATPARARVFEKLGIDYCCGGKRTLTDQAAAREADSAIIQEIADDIAYFEQALHEQIFEGNQILFRRLSATRIL